jgi:hypothetical protein
MAKSSPGSSDIADLAGAVDHAELKDLARALWLRAWMRGSPSNGQFRMKLST